MLRLKRMLTIALPVLLLATAPTAYFQSQSAPVKVKVGDVEYSRIQCHGYDERQDATGGRPRRPHDRDGSSQWLKCQYPCPSARIGV
jgi:hypothetical protein